MTGKPSLAAQEATAIAWIQSELALHNTTNNATDVPSFAPTDSLCEFLRDGRALCLLAHALAIDQHLGDEHALPKKLEKSLHQLQTFHALERIHFFIRWCRSAVHLEEQHIFTSVQLLDEANAAAVLACVDALRQRFRPKFEESAEEHLVTPTPTEDEEEDRLSSTSSASSSYRAAPLVSASTSSASSSGNKLLSFLSQVPSPSVATSTSGTSGAGAERPPSITKRLSNSSFTSSIDRSSSTSSTTNRGATSSFISDLADEEDSARSSTLSAPPSSPKSTISKLKMPSVFGGGGGASASANNSPTKEEEEDTKPKGVAKLEIPSVFGRQRSLSNTEDSTPRSSVTEEPPAKPTARSVSKLTIPAAFSSGAPTTPTPPPQEEEEEAPPAPQQPLSLASFVASFEPEPPAPAPTAVVEEKRTRKLKIPEAFGKAVGAAAPLKMEKKRVSKLAAFLSTVEPANETTAPVPAPSPLAFKKWSRPAPVEPAVVVADRVEEPTVEEVAFEAEVADTLASSEPAVVADKVEEVEVHEEKSSVVTEEPVATPADDQSTHSPSVASQRSNKLLAFLAAVESTPVVVSAPAVDDMSELVHEEKTTVEVDFTDFTTGSEVQSEEEMEEFELVDASEGVEAVESTEEKEETAQVEEEEEHEEHEEHEERSSSLSHQESEDERFSNSMIDSFPDHDPIVEVSGELTHEISTSPLPTPRKPSASRELFPESEELLSTEETVAAMESAVVVGHPVAVEVASAAATSTVSETQFTALQQAKELLETEKLVLQQQLAQAETVAATQSEQLTTLESELAALRAQLQTQQIEAQEAQETAIAAVRRELAEAAAAKEHDLQAAVATALATSQADTASATEQLQQTTTLAEQRLEELTALREELATASRLAQQAKDSEDAARFAAQVAFAARDEAEEKLRAFE